MIGIAFVTIARITRRRRAVFAAGAATASAEVVDNQWRNVSYSSDASLLAFPLLRYRLPDGTLVEQLSFEGASPPVARTGSVVDVLYDPADPRRVRVAKDRAVHGALLTFFVVMGILTAVVGILMMAGAIALTR